jgi:hypothetical protein
MGEASRAALGTRPSSRNVLLPSSGPKNFLGNVVENWEKVDKQRAVPKSIDQQVKI